MSLYNFLEHIRHTSDQPHDVSSCRWRGMQKYLETRFKEGDTVESVMKRLFMDY